MWKKAEKTKQIKVNSMKNDLDIFSPFAKQSKGAERLTSNNCIIYTRVSSKEQQEGYSLDLQKKVIVEYAEKAKLNIIGFFGGVYESAKTDERKEFNKMLTFARRSREKVSLILVYSVDRFSRSGANAIYIAETLRKENIRIFAIQQPSDTSTASGKFMQNIQFIFSEYDNDQRREKCTSGMREMLLDGYWPNRVPLGYDQKMKGKEQIITVNEKGKILRKAFEWKAEGIYNNLEIKDKLKALGLNVSKQSLTCILRNPFYCGIMTSNLLNGQVIEGRHEKLISKELFVKINSLGTKNPKGKTAEEFNEVPLKHFIKCGECSTPFSGYVVKKKGLWYYKCNKKGCKCNRSAKALNNKFESLLNRYALNEKYIEPIKSGFMYVFNESTAEIQQTERALKTKLTEINNKIEAVEEKLILSEIDREVYNKFKTKYLQEKNEVSAGLQKFNFNLSNLENCIEKYCYLLMKPSQLWASSDFKNKTIIQNIVFPNGLVFDRKNDDYRTENINEVISCFALLSKDLENEKSRPSNLFLEKSASVAGAGFEPTTFGL